MVCGIKFVSQYMCTYCFLRFCTCRRRFKTFKIEWFSKFSMCFNYKCVFIGKWSVCVPNLKCVIVYGYFFLEIFSIQERVSFFSAVSRLSVVCVICAHRPQRLARAGVPFIARGLVTSARPPANPSASPPVRQPAHLSVRRSVGGRGDKDSVDALPPSRAQCCRSLFVSESAVHFFFFLLVFLSMSCCIFFFLFLAIAVVGRERVFRFVRRNVVVKIK